MALHCAECGFVNPETANFCQKCGAPIVHETGLEPSTATYRLGETGDFIPVDLEEVISHGAALVIRSGGGRVGESIPLAGERMTIGRRPDSDLFLDDVTVSRDHALLIRRASDWFLRHALRRKRFAIDWQAVLELRHETTRLTTRPGT